VVIAAIMVIAVIDLPMIAGDPTSRNLELLLASSLPIFVVDMKEVVADMAAEGDIKEREVVTLVSLASEIAVHSGVEVVVAIIVPGQNHVDSVVVVVEVEVEEEGEEEEEEVFNLFCHCIFKFCLKKTKQNKTKTGTVFSSSFDKVSSQLSSWWVTTDSVFIFFLHNQPQPFHLFVFIEKRN